MPNQIEHLTAVLVRTRKDKGLKQRDIAELLQTAQANVSNWERGFTAPNLDTFAQWCNVLGVEIKLYITNSQMDSLAD